LTRLIFLAAGKGPGNSKGPEMQTPLTSISAVTLVVADMSEAYRFYESLGFEPNYGGERASFSSFKIGTSYLNLELAKGPSNDALWGRVIFYVDDVDVMHGHVLALGLQPEAAPRDAEWHERFFHLRDPDGNELSFAKLLE